jgi:hypothetical protein
MQVFALRSAAAPSVIEALQTVREMLPSKWQQHRRGASEGDAG